ncbi:MAG TPA: hypothetical protein DIC53_00550, partial [Synergistaceae bacterium]|nr:hypothetical protein [Synergistaceae bacterium]
SLAKQHQAARLAPAEAAYSIRVIEQPVVLTKPVAPNRKLIVALSGVLGLFAGVFGALIAAFAEGRRQKGTA